MKKNFLGAFIALIGVFLALAPLATSAAQFKADGSGSVFINEPLNDDIYAGGNTVSLNAPVTGDAVMAGATVLVNNAVEQSLLAAGGTVTVSGSISDDVRIVGGNVFVNGPVRHDVIVLAGQVVVSRSASIGGDLIVLGGTVSLDAPVAGNVYVRGSEVAINSSVGGSVDAKADVVKFGSQASINGKLVYSAQKDAMVGGETAKGGVEFTKFERKNPKDARGFSVGLVIGLIMKAAAAFVLALLVALVFKKRAAVVIGQAMQRFGGNLLYGFATIVLVPLAAIIAAITLVGLPVSFIAMCAYAIGIAVSGIVTPILIGGWVWKKFKKTKEYEAGAITVLIGTLVYVVLGLIPILGWAFNAVFMLVIFGYFARMTVNAVMADAKR